MNVETIQPRRRAARPYVMRGPPVATRPRPMLADQPDRREVPGRPGVRLSDSPEPAVVTVARLRARARKEPTDHRLRPVDMVLQRWAATPTGESGLPGGWPRQPRCTLAARSAGGPGVLLDADAEQVSQVLSRCPDWVVRFVVGWYRTALGIPELMQELGIARREGVYLERTYVLAHIDGRLRERGMSLPEVAWG